MPFENIHTRSGSLAKYWHFYRWGRHKSQLRNKYKGKHRNVIKALSRNKSPESQRLKEQYKSEHNLS